MQMLSTPWITIALAFVAGMVTLVVFRMVWPALTRRRGDRDVLERAAWFHDRIVGFREQATTLDQHSNEYVAVFSDDHWSSLMKMLNQLETVDRQIQRLLQGGRTDDARALLGYICDSRRNSSMEQLSAGLDEAAQELLNWEQTVHAMLRRVISNLETATTATERITTAHQTKRKQPTLVTLADIKKRLLEDEAFLSDS